MFRHYLVFISFFRQKLLKWNGWGYNDSKFIVAPEDLAIHFLGTRYNDFFLLQQKKKMIIFK